MIDTNPPAIVQSVDAKADAILLALEHRIDANENNAIMARWEFGRELLARRVGKQLPKGLLDKLCEQTGKSRSELQYRMQFASRYKTASKVSNALDTLHSWSDIIFSLKQERKAEAREPTAAEANGVSSPNIEDFIGGDFACIYADPAWSYGNQATRASTGNHYDTMSVADICALPVAQIAAQNAHLHLWTTNGFLKESFEVMEAWGFSYRSVLVWVKPQMGIGNYWRVSHEYLMFGLRGKCPFQSRSLMSWVEADRTKHSAKPESVRTMIESASPGPRLELFARKCAPGWSAWGNQIERMLHDCE